MKTKKALITTLTALTLASPILGATTVSAATWHNGLPSFLKKHPIWISNFQKLKGQYYAYQKNGIYFQKDNSFWTGAYFFDASKKYQRDGSSMYTVYGPQYKKLNKKTYLFRGTKNEISNSYYRITKYSNSKIHVRAKSDGAYNNKWETLGTLKPGKEPNR